MIEILQKMHDFGVIPVVSIPSPEDAPRLGEALLRGGLPCAEITFRTAAAEEAIANASQANASTVKTLADADKSEAQTQEILAQEH